jgi:hypothetical protein
MDPDSQAVLVAQHQQELRTESEERRRAARILTDPGPLRMWLSGRLIALGEALIGMTAASSEDHHPVNTGLPHIHRGRSLAVGHCVPPCHRLSSSPALAHHTAHPEHGGGRCPANGR